MKKCLIPERILHNPRDHLPVHPCWLWALQVHGDTIVCDQHLAKGLCVKQINPKYFVPVLILVQAACAVFFVSDVISDGYDINGHFSLSSHLMIEALATIGLVFGIIFETSYLRSLLAQNRRAEQNLRAATGALQEVIDDYFRDWALTPSEQDVALFAIKGLSNAEIAGLRQSSEGTIKAHLNAVFRKAGVSGRSQLISLLVEDLLAAPLIAAETPGQT